MEADVMFEAQATSVPGNSANSPAASRFEIVVVGAGYVGLVTAACFARLGHRVRVVDLDDQRVGSLRSGLTPIAEPGLGSFVRDGLGAGRLSFETQLEPALANAEMVFIAVGTLDTAGRWTEDHVRSVIMSVLSAERVPPLIVIRSTLRPGSLRRFQWLVLASERPTHLLFNPEFTREGSAVTDFMAPHRIVVGIAAQDPVSVAEPIQKMYEGIDAPFLVVDHASAELIKVGSNAFLAAKITFANELARVCVAADADMAKVRKGIGMDPRIGAAFLAPGPGIGGSCLPSQVELLTLMSEELGLGLELIPAINRSNRSQPRRLAQDLLAEISTTARIAIFGLAFKAGTDDVRESPSLHLIDALQESGVTEISAYDPEVRVLPTRPWVRILRDPYAAAERADVLVIATEWPEFRTLDWARLARVMTGREVFDARSIISAEGASAMGFRVRSLERQARPRTGRPPTNGHATSPERDTITSATGAGFAADS
jgi:UDPglucose 6-dehydrogenase